jgi:hypothetical protein
MRGHSLIIVLLVVAFAVLTAVAGAVVGDGVYLSFITEYQFLWGLAVAQLQLAAAATVFLRRWLVLRTIALVACLLLWTAVFAEPSDRSWTAVVALIFLTVVLVTAAWCGLLTFGGWRLEMPLTTSGSVVHRRQFTLATLLIATTIACIYGGLWRWIEFTWFEYSALMPTMLCTVAGCTLFKATARGTWPWLPIATLVAIVVLVQLLPDHRYLTPAAWVLPVLVVQVSHLLGILAILRFAGIYLVNDAVSALVRKRKFNSLAAAKASRSSAAPPA